MEWVLRNQVIRDFFYEHCALFARTALITLFQTAGFKIESIRHVFGGQYLWVEAMLAEDDIRVMKRPDNMPEPARQFGVSEIALRDARLRKVHQLVEREGLPFGEQLQKE